jgi:hypothetical protein
LSIPKLTRIELASSEIGVIKLLGEAVAGLQESIGLNDWGLPYAFIDPQIIAETGLIKENLPPDILEKAKKSLDYFEGYPVVDDLPFWEKLDGELIYFYNLFKAYRELKDTEDTRSFAKVAELSNQPLPTIVALSKAYHWKARAKAYDIYLKQRLDIIKQKNIEETENKHHKAAKELFELCIEGIKKVLKDFKDNQKGLTQEDMRAWLRMAVKMERVSLGLPPETPLNNDEKEAINVVANYQMNKLTNNNNQQLTVTHNKLEKVLNILSKTGALKNVLESMNGSNGNKKIEQEVFEGEVIDDTE